MTKLRLSLTGLALALAMAAGVYAEGKSCCPDSSCCNGKACCKTKTKK